MTVRELRQLLAGFEPDLDVVIYTGCDSTYTDPAARLIRVLDCPQAGLYRHDRESAEARTVLSLDTR